LVTVDEKGMHFPEKVIEVIRVDEDEGRVVGGWRVEFILR